MKHKGKRDSAPYADGDYAEMWVEAGGQGLEEAIAQFIPPQKSIEMKGRLRKEDIQYINEIKMVYSLFPELSNIEPLMLAALDDYQKLRLSEDGYSFEIFADMIASRYRRSRGAEKGGIIDRLFGSGSKDIVQQEE